MKKIIIGQIIKPQGIKGELKVKPYVDDVNIFNKLDKLFLENEQSIRNIENVSIRNNFVYLTIFGVSDRNKAEGLRNKLLYLPAEQIKQDLEEDEYLIEEILGFEVVDDTGKPIGKLEDISNYGSLDVYTVKTKTGYLRFPNAPEVIAEIVPSLNKIVLNSKKLVEVAIYEG